MADPEAIDRTVYPKCKYNRDLVGKCVVNSPSEEAALGPDWFDHPSPDYWPKPVVEKRGPGRPPKPVEPEPEAKPIRAGTQNGLS